MKVSFIGRPREAWNSGRTGLNASQYDQDRKGGFINEIEHIRNSSKVLVKNRGVTKNDWARYDRMDCECD